MGRTDYMASNKAVRAPKVAYMRVSSSTNSRSTIATYLGQHPAGDSVFFFVPQKDKAETATLLAAVFSRSPLTWLYVSGSGGLNLSES